MRDEVLTRFVSQPDADPIYQYLRDAEKESAWELLGAQDSVLDIASESNITAGLDADTVARTDFSASAIEYAREVLGDDVDRYEWVEPESPHLPFDDDAFDAAVSMGPYDWRFLDIETLTSEVRRVVKPNGLYVFSTPTPRSPYETGGKYRQRYYTPEEARSLFAPGFRETEVDCIYQHPYWLHSKLAMLPGIVQRPFVHRAATRTETLDDVDDASYLVWGVRPFDYQGHLEDALWALFRPTSDNGFWNAEEGRFVRALEYEITGDRAVPRSPRDLTWRVEAAVKWRYAPFALMGVLQWRVSDVGDERFDAQLERQLAYFTHRVADRLDEMPSYGIGPLICAFSLAADVFDDAHLETARDLFRYANESDRFDFTDSEDSLLLYGYTYLYERAPDPEIRDAIDAAMYDIVEQQNAWKTLFYFDNPTTRRHQNQMYTLWGLCRGIEVTDRPGYLENVEAVLDYTIEERMREDGAFIWEDPPKRAFAGVELRRRLGSGDGRPPHWEFLYACHQTFFVVAVAHYYAAGGQRDYDRELGEAMAWLDEANDLGTDLTALSGLGVPMRFLTTDGRMDVPDQMYKGAYEIGANVMALTKLVEQGGA